MDPEIKKLLIVYMEKSGQSLINLIIDILKILLFRSLHHEPVHGPRATCFIELVQRKAIFRKEI